MSVYSVTDELHSLLSTLTVRIKYVRNMLYETTVMEITPRKVYSLSLSLHFNGHFPGEPRLAGVYWSRDDWGGGDNCTTGAVSRAKLQSNHHHQHPVFYRPDALPVAQPTVSKHWREKYHIPWTCLPQAHLGVFQLCFWPLIAPGYLGEGCHAYHQPCDASTPVIRKSDVLIF